uniref:RRM domain-containing protein n=1 Tax=Rhabditophanes sp. KR3021 TaxID=114890 RepID=A0AC35UA83_9BILA
MCACVLEMKNESLLSAAVSIESLDSTYMLNGENKENVRTLFVSGLPFDVKQRELYLLFRAYPGYETSQLKVTSKHGKTTTPVGFVTFSSKCEAEEAKRQLHGIKFDPENGATLRLELAKANTKTTRLKNQNSPPIMLPPPQATSIYGGAGSAAALASGLNPSAAISAAAAAANSPYHHLTAPFIGQAAASGFYPDFGFDVAMLTDPNAYLALQTLSQLPQFAFYQTTPTVAKTQRSSPTTSLAAAIAAQTSAVAQAAGGNHYGHAVHPCSTLFVANLPPNVGEEEIKTLFRGFPGFSRQLNKYVRSITNKQSKVFAEHVTSPDIYIDSINATDLFITFDGVDLSNARNLALYLENYGNQIRLSDSLRVVFDGQLIKTSIVQVKDVVTTIVKINRCIKTLKFVFTRRTSQSDDLVLNNFSLQGCDNEETYINSLESIKQMESDYVEKIDGLAIEALLEQIENKYLFAHLFERFRSLNHFKVVVHSLKIFSNVNSDLLAQFLSILSERPNPRLELLFLHGEFGDRSKEMGTMQKLFELCFDKKIVLNFDADEHTMTEIGDYSFATIPDITKLSLQLALEAENLQENGRPIVNVPKFEWKSLDKLRTLNINFPCQFEAQEMAKIMEQFQNTESLNKLYLKFNQSCVEISPPTIASVFDHLPRHISHLKLENAITSFADQIDRLPTLLPHILSMAIPEYFFNNRKFNLQGNTENKEESKIQNITLSPLQLTIYKTLEAFRESSDLSEAIKTFGDNLRRNNEATNKKIAETKPEQTYDMSIATTAPNYKNEFADSFFGRVNFTKEAGSSTQHPVLKQEFTNSFYSNEVKAYMRK